jgi:hypothetical protein
MAKTSPNIKTVIPKDENVFYVFKLSGSEYLLYDSYMGDPIAYGSLNLISGKLEAHFKQLNNKLKQNEAPREIYAYKLERDASKGWKLDENMNGISYKSPTNIKGTFQAAIPKSPLKDIGYDSVYFWFDLGNIHYLYDSDLGSPIYYGNPNKIKGTILVHSKKHKFSAILFYFPSKANKPTYKMTIKYDVSEEDKKQDLKKKKKEEDINPTPPNKQKEIKEV